MADSDQFNYSLLKACGTDVFISPRAEFRRPQLISIGKHVAIDSGVYITTGAQLGDYIHIAPYTTVIGGATALLTMEHFSGIAAGARIICASEKYLGEGLIGPTVPDEFRDEIYYGNITFKRFTTVGTNAVIMPGVTLAEGSVVGACSLLTKDTEPWTIYTGIPARPVKARKKEKLIEYAKRLGY